MSYNPDLVCQTNNSPRLEGQLADHPKIPISPSELKHQPGRNVLHDNTVDILRNVTHLPPDCTFLPRNAERITDPSTRVEDKEHGGQ